MQLTATSSRNATNAAAASCLARGSTGAIRFAPSAGFWVKPTASRRCSNDSRSSFGPMGSTIAGHVGQHNRGARRLGIEAVVGERRALASLLRQHQEALRDQPYHRRLLRKAHLPFRGAMAAGIASRYKTGPRLDTYR